MDLPAGKHNRHWARNINTNSDSSKIYIAVGSGLRNPAGMGWAPGTKTLWTAVNERDGLGDGLVPYYFTSVRHGGFYGWPYTYFGQNEDLRVNETKPLLVKKTIIPDVNLGSHTASVGLAFYTANSFPEKYQGGVFIAQN